MKTICLIWVGALLIVAGGCMVGPKYQRPAVDAPEAFRAADSDTNAPSGPASFGDLGWWEAFGDPQLTAYVAEALTNSWDVKIAVTRVLQAEAAARLARSKYFPTLGAGGDLQSVRTSEKGPSAMPSGADPQKEYGDLFLSVPAYELDLWGKIRSENESARAQLLATVEAERTVRQTLVAEVATTYLSLRELDLELEVARSTCAVRTNSLELTSSRQQGGVASMQDVYQARMLVFTAESAIADTLRRIEQQENQLCILLGRNPGGLARGPALTSQVLRAEVPAGLPSSLLERRPDIRAAEQLIVAANADIRQAKAAYYPQLTLTGLFGFQTVAFSDLLSSGARTWQFGPAVSVPLFTGGRLGANVKLAEARFQEAIASYQKTVQGAFREVSDGLIAYQRTREFYEKQTERTQANRDAAAMATVRYEGGVTSYLEVLYNEQELFSAELGLAQARLSELLSVVQLYRALGGGWQPPEQAVAQK